MRANAAWHRAPKAAEQAEQDSLGLGLPGLLVRSSTLLLAGNSKDCMSMYRSANYLLNDLRCSLLISILQELYKLFARAISSL